MVFLMVLLIFRVATLIVISGKNIQLLDSCKRQTIVVTDMEPNVEALSELGCCLRCSLRFSGQRATKLYEPEKNLEIDIEDDIEPVSKKPKKNVCICCLGLLQPELWNSVIQALKNEKLIDSYDCDHFACGLSLPASTILREHCIITYLKEIYPSWESDIVVPFKQAWKWSFGEIMGNAINKVLDSGSVCPFLITVHMQYKYDTQELDGLQKMVPQIFEDRQNSYKKFRGEMFTRVGIDNILKKIDPVLFKKTFLCPPESPDEPLECSKIECQHNPIYIGGRYIKYSRELSQTPWILDGKRMMEDSIQEIIFRPLAEFFKIPPESIDSQLKFISSGREDVDVRCLGDGRPFAVEILNPNFTKLKAEQLTYITDLMSSNTKMLKVERLQLIQKEDLTTLKMGEEVKTKNYEALCIKVVDKSTSDDVKIELMDYVTEKDIKTINSLSNGTDGIVLDQKTPLRVLHRRPLLKRNRKIFDMKASLIQGMPNMFAIEMTTEAGTYIKEFIHGDFGRTTPNLSQMLGFKVDILALDVKSINLEWPIQRNKT